MVCAWFSVSKYFVESQSSLVNLCICDCPCISFWGFDFGLFFNNLYQSSKTIFQFDQKHLSALYPASLYQTQYCVKSLQSCLTLCDPGGPQPARLFSPLDSPGKNTVGGCHALLQGIFPTQGLNPRLLHLLHCRWILYH